MRTFTVEQVASTIDHALLRTEVTEVDLKEAVDLCQRWGVASLCVRPCDVKRAVALLDESDVMVSCVLSFPHGADTTEIKALQAEQAICDGVDEIDMVMNVGQFLSGEVDYVQRDIEAVVQVAHRSAVMVKVILETCYLTREQIKKACVLCETAGADFVKTSTGFGSGGATVEAVEAMIRVVGGRLGVKASGGIRNWEDAVRFLDMGASRLGIGATDAVLSGFKSNESY